MGDLKATVNICNLLWVRGEKMSRITTAWEKVVQKEKEKTQWRSRRAQKF